MILGQSQRGQIFYPATPIFDKGKFVRKARFTLHRTSFHRGSLSPHHHPHPYGSRKVNTPIRVCVARYRLRKTPYPSLKTILTRRSNINRKRTKSRITRRDGVEYRIDNIVRFDCFTLEVRDPRP